LGADFPRLSRRSEQNEVDFHYLIAIRQDMDSLLTGMPTYLILVEMQIRCFQLTWHKDRFWALLQRFYEKIYVAQKLELHLLATRLNSTVYLLVLFNFVLVPVKNVTIGGKFSTSRCIPLTTRNWDSTSLKIKHETWLKL